jgi:hypothetical protein
MISNDYKMRATKSNGTIKTGVRVRWYIAFEIIQRNLRAGNPFAWVSRAMPSQPLPQQNLFSDVIQFHPFLWLNNEGWIEGGHRSQA